MRRSCLVLTAALLLAGCSFEDPPAPGAAAGPTAVASAPTTSDPCTEIVLTLLDGQLNGLPTADAATFDRANRVTEAFQQRYDAVIAGSGIEAARAQYAAEIEAACTG